MHLLETILVLVATSFDTSWILKTSNASSPELHKIIQSQRQLVVIGSFADLSTNYDTGKPITIIHMLEFSTDVPLREPALLQVRLCGDQSDLLTPFVHTNITLVYDPTSHSRLTGCLTLISSKAWHDGSTLRLATSPFHKVQRRMNRGKSIQSIINDPSVR